VSGATQSSKLAYTTFMGSHVRCSLLNYTLFTNCETHIILARSQPKVKKNAPTSVAVSVSLREICGEPQRGFLRKWNLLIKKKIVDLFSFSFWITLM
jgi:hypothetical protein